MKFLFSLLTVLSFGLINLNTAQAMQEMTDAEMSEEYLATSLSEEEGLQMLEAHELEKYQEMLDLIEDHQRQIELQNELHRSNFNIFN